MNGGAIPLKNPSGPSLCKVLLITVRILTFYDICIRTFIWLQNQRDTCFPINLLKWLSTNYIADARDRSTSEICKESVKVYHLNYRVV